MDTKDIKTYAHDETLHQGELEMGHQLAKYFTQLVPLIGGAVAVPPVGSDDYTKMAHDLTTTGKFTVKSPDGEQRLIAIEDLDKKLPTSVKATLGIQKSLSELWAKPTQVLYETASIIGNVAEEQSGWMSMIKNAVVGFFNWMMSGFKGGLMESIAHVAAGGMQEAVSQKLSDLRQHDPNAATYLTDKRIAEIAGEARDSTLRMGHVDVAVKPVQIADLPQPLGVSNEERKMIGNALSEKVRIEAKAAMTDKVAQAIEEHGVYATNLGDAWDKSKNTVLSWVGIEGSKSYTLPGAAEFDTVADSVGKSVGFITDPNFRLNGKTVSHISPAELQTTLQGHIRTQLFSASRNGNLPSFDEKRIDSTAVQAAAGIVAHYNELPIIPDLPDSALAAVKNAGNNARGAGMGTGANANPNGVQVAAANNGNSEQLTR